MRTYDFLLMVTGVDPFADEFEARFYAVGCNDATVCYQNGEVLLDFSREAGSLIEAIDSAIADIKAAGAELAYIILKPKALSPVSVNRTPSQ